MKVFTNHSHVVANCKSGQVYSYEAVKELNIKAKNWTDLVTGEPFQKSDIVTLQNPKDTKKSVIVDVAKIRAEIREGRKTDVASSSTSNIRASGTMKRVLDAMNQAEVAAKKRKRDAGVEKLRSNRAGPSGRFTTGMCASSFTSTAISPITQNERSGASSEQIAKDRYDRVRRLKKKGHVRIRTSRGNLNVELHCDLVPRTTENFLQLAKRGYYEGVTFHRLIKHFMVQGGDPTGSGKGGESCWGQPFKDEFHSALSHDGRGVLSMANAGPDSNGSQFFITFKSCHHLDRKHSVFGRVVGGLPTLRAIELVDTDSSDRPVETIRIIECSVFTDPFAEVDAASKATTIKRKKKSDVVVDRDDDSATSSSSPPVAIFRGRDDRGEVGKYLKKKRRAFVASEVASPEETNPVRTLARSKKAPKKTTFGDFSAW
eukprot:g1856.t1